MNAPTKTVPVIAVPISCQPDAGRQRIDVPAGLTIAEIVAIALPGALESTLQRTRVALIKGDGLQVIPRAVWHCAKPHAGVHVVIRIIPGKQALQSVLSILVAVAATAIAGFFAPGLAVGLGIGTNTARGILTFGLAPGGRLFSLLDREYGR